MRRNCMLWFCVALTGAGGIGICSSWQNYAHTTHEFSLTVYMCVPMYVHVHVCTCVSMCICVPVCTYVYVCTYVHVCAYVHVCYVLRYSSSSWRSWNVVAFADPEAQHTKVRPELFSCPSHSFERSVCDIGFEQGLLGQKMGLGQKNGGWLARKKGFSEVRLLTGSKFLMKTWV
jgi:hypothetical protein